MTASNKPELLAPAGGMEQLQYALYFGADAVYLACDKFGLRTRAQNFSLEELPSAVAFAHNHGARVYVTCNAYAHDRDLADLPRYAQALEAAQVDAAIVSDLGVLSVLKEHAPSVALHISTQASVSNAAAARAFYELGAKRVVCAREMSLAEIAQLKREIPADMEVEVFVHGAMCMAISGRCLISDYLTGRSANQGHCVQPCRWEYVLQEPSRPGQYFPVEQDARGTYLMNSKDLNMLAHVDELCRAGVDSIKIEGRVKKAFYVATVVNAYRHVLDGEDPSVWEPELETMSHRPYSTGFFFGPAEQTFDDDVYTQRYDWVAQVKQAKQAEQTSENSEQQHSTDQQHATAQQHSADSWLIEVYCRNRFYEGDTLEVLSPHMPINQVRVTHLCEVFPAYSAHSAYSTNVPHDVVPADVQCDVCSASTPPKASFTDAASYNYVPCEVANKAMGVYAFTAPFPLHEHDILRVLRKDPSKKN